MPNYNQLSTCTVELPGGNFCDAPAAEDMPFPICSDHAYEIYLHMHGTARREELSVMAGPVEIRYLPPRPPGRTIDPAREAAKAAQSQVYYIRFNRHIKIGVTTNMVARMSQLRVARADVLATEPGDRDLELQRHRQFAAWRIGRTEDFYPTPEVMAHVQRTLNQQGPPLMTSWVDVQGTARQAQRLA